MSEEQPVWEEFLQRMEQTFKEYLKENAFGERFERFLANLDLGYVIQEFLERFNLKDYFVHESPTLYGGKTYNILKKLNDKKRRYKSEKELYNKACNFDDSAISGSEKKVLTALIGLSANYRWDLYLALSEFIDSFLW